MITNIITFPRKFYEGDSATIVLSVDADLTGYSGRCQIKDDIENVLQLATADKGGSVSEMVISGGSTSTITIYVAKDSTDTFRQNCIFEVEVEDTAGKVTTLIKKKFTLINTDLNWTSK